jgi:ABC-type oligopeptide transport system ATPase subunit
MAQNDEKREKILEIKDLCMEFQDGKQTVKAVNHVSFDVYKGENFGLVGESGCGKTTLGRTLIRLYDPTSGEILFNGKNISGKLNRADRDYVTRNLAMIFQDPISSLNPRMTVQEIIEEGLKTRGEKDKEVLRKAVSDILTKVGLLPEHSTRYPHEFSGGQRQRIGIARSLVVKPSFIIADEPVSALDVSIQAQVINLLMDIKKEMDLTILFIAHNLAVVKYFSDRIGVMYFGNMVELADADELYDHPVHPYTKALLSAIPQPDPLSEKNKERLYYDPSIHDYSVEQPRFQEIRPGHFVYASDSEMEKYRKELEEQG